MNAPANISVAARIHANLRDRLLTAFPELGEDEQALLDTLEGESPLPDVLAKLLREARAREAQARGLGDLIQEMETRLDRLMNGAKRIREIVKHAMLEAGIAKLNPPDFTASFSSGKASVIVDADLNTLPDHLVRIKREPNKTAILAALLDGDMIDGCTLKNLEPTLTVRGK